jgi:hypothetical protein
MTTEATQNTATLEVTTAVETPVAATETLIPSTPTQPSDILSMLSDDLKGVKSFEKFKGKDVNELAKSYASLEQLIGKKVSEMPEDVVKQFLKVPSSPKEYALADEAKALINDKILEVAHKSNLSQEQLKALTDTLVEGKRAELASAEAEAAKLLEAGKKELEAEFGIALDKRLDAVKKVMNQYGGKELQETLTKAGVLHDAKFIKFLDKITQEALSTKLVGADYIAQKALTPEESLKEIQAKKADPVFMSKYMNYREQGHDQAVEEWQNLFNHAYGSSR